MTHTDAEVAEALAPYFPDTDLSVLETVSARYRSIGAWNETPAMGEEGLNRLQDVMEEAGELQERVEFQQLVDNSYAEKAVNS